MYNIAESERERGLTAVEWKLLNCKGVKASIIFFDKGFAFCGSEFLRLACCLPSPLIRWVSLRSIREPDISIFRSTRCLRAKYRKWDFRRSGAMYDIYPDTIISYVNKHGYLGAYKSVIDFQTMSIASAPSINNPRHPSLSLTEINSVLTRY